jgi:hypothetical protein
MRLAYRIPSLVCTIAASTALAQELPSDARGFRIGSGRVHPYLQVDTRYVLNPGRSSQQSVGDMVLVARPGVDLLLPSDTLDLAFNGDVEYRQYLGIDTTETQDFSTLMGKASLDAHINKTGAVAVRLYEQFLRSADPGNETISQRLLHISNDVGVGFDIRPGGGALILGPSFSFVYLRYDRDQDSVATSPEELDNLRFRPKLRVAWKFLPKTALFLEGEADLTRYPTSTINVDANILHAYLGASGSLTQRIALVLKAGYANTLIPDEQLSGDSNFSSFVGQGEFNFLASETLRLRAGVLRSVQSTPLFKYFDTIRAYAGINQAFGRLQLQADVSYNYLTYGTALRGPTGARHDQDVVANLMVLYQITDWLTISVSESANFRESDYTTEDETQFDYFMNDLFLRVSARY